MMIVPMRYNGCNQGCIRPRPSPFERPSTRDHGVLTSLRVVFDCRFGARGSIAGFSDSRARSAQNDAEGAVLEIFEDFLKILPYQCIQRALKLLFKDLPDGPIFVRESSKNLTFSPGRSKSTCQRPDDQFCAEKLTIESRIHKTQ